MTKKQLLILLSCALFATGVIIASISLYPYFKQLTSDECQMRIKEFISELGILGPLFLFIIQFLQVVIAFIPGEPFEILSGVLYGAYGGLIICLIGCISASALIFKLSEKYGKRLLYFFFGEVKISQWTWLRNSKRIDIITFILFLIPGTPKDMLTYIVGLSEMRLSKFIILSTIARIPSILSSTLAGATIRNGNFKMSAILFLAAGTVGITGILLKDKILTLCKKAR